ncbi:uncharacterized protein LOC6503773 isoform X1 [Drosophila ananassae]|uniref:uncharacterized protein LOC6503773 isoform X1 n=1 Tax=Drosophila ananassae TaxID=7217 RepID=UPI001CFFFFF4|nr:uncharacterized protein LOC6503773 isoform X1 [Drosophila ananassae]
MHKVPKKQAVEHPSRSFSVCSTDSVDKYGKRATISPVMDSFKTEVGPVEGWHQKINIFRNISNKQAYLKKFDAKNKSRNTNRLKRFWKVTKDLCALRSNNGDGRPYTIVKILDRNIKGLMDTGASMSCIGGQFAQEVMGSEVPIHRVFNNVSTADGSKLNIIGRLSTNIEYNGQIKAIQLYIVPSLKQNLYLGVDFWKLFDLLPPNIQISELSAHNLTQDQKETLQGVVDQFPSFASAGLGKTNLLSHHIDVGEAKPIKQRHFPVSPAVEKLLYGEVDRMLELGVVEESDSAWSSPVVLVQKPGKVRLCLDSRKVNAVTVKDAYPLPQIDGILSRLPKAMFISSLDLKDAFWQIPLDPASRDKTAFTIPGRPLYQFKVMPFGLCNAGQTMSRLMDKVIPASLRNEVFIYLDDLLLVSDTFENHIRVLKTVADCIRSAGLTINVQKSHFCVQHVKYLGHVIGEGEIRTDPEKVAAIEKFPLPKTLKSLRSFLGMAGWYRKFIDNFATVAAPLTDLLRAKRKFTMTEKGHQAFIELKRRLCTAPVLRSPDFTKPFYIQCDASKSGVGGVLVQKTEQGDEYPIAFVSKKLNKAQRNYSVTEQECLAAIVGVKRFRPYVEGQDFTIITDHASLKWLMGQSDLSSRLARWALKLQGFKFKIEHRRGSLNVVPDALSRVNEDEIASIDASHGLLVDVASEHFQGPEYLSLVDSVRANSAKLPDLKVVDNLVYRRSEHATGEPLHDVYIWKLWVPLQLVGKVLKNAHDHPLAAHGGVHKTLERVRRYYYWPGLVSDVKTYVSNCDACKATKAPNCPLRPPMGKAPESQRFFQRLYIDFLGPYPRSRSGNIAIFIVLDHFSKFVFLKAIKKMESTVVVKYMKEELFHLFGVPELIVSDNGTQFRAELFQKLLREHRITHKLTAIHAPQANASERVNRSIITAIRAYVDTTQKDWDVNLSSICCALRSATHSSLGTSPYYMVFGQHMVTSGGTYALLRSLQSLQDRGIAFTKSDSLELAHNKAVMLSEKRDGVNRDRYNLRSREISYSIGQEVFRRNFKQSSFQTGYNAKLSPAFVKARVRQKLGNSYYDIEDLQGKLVGRYHAKDLRQ